MGGPIKQLRKNTLIFIAKQKSGSERALHEGNMQNTQIQEMAERAMQ